MKQVALGKEVLFCKPPFVTSDLWFYFGKLTADTSKILYEGQGTLGLSWHKASYSICLRLVLFFNIVCQFCDCNHVEVPLNWRIMSALQIDMYKIKYD